MNRVLFVFGVLLLLSTCFGADTVPSAPVQSSQSVSLQSLIDSQNALRGDIQTLRQDLFVYKQQSTDELNTWRYNELAFLGCINIGFICVVLVMMRVMRYRDIVLGQKRFNDQVSALCAIVGDFRTDFHKERELFEGDLVKLRVVVDDVKAAQDKVQTNSQNSLPVNGPAPVFSFWKRYRLRIILSLLALFFLGVVLAFSAWRYFSG